MGNYKQYQNIDHLIGKTFGRLKIIKDLGYLPYNNRGRRKCVECECQCDKHTIVKCTLTDVVSGEVKSCGCLMGKSAITHNKSNTRLYREFYGMHYRCYNKNSKAYERYGGRGIYICDEWLDLSDHNMGFQRFEKWAYENGYYDQPKETPHSELLTIDRIDNDGPYAPWNCRWIPHADQNKNKRNNSYIWDGEELLHHRGFIKKYNLPDHFIVGKLMHGWSIDAIVYAAKHKDEKIKRASRVQQESKGFPYYLNGNGFMVLIPKLPPVPEEYLKIIERHTEYHKSKNSKTYF